LAFQRVSGEAGGEPGVYLIPYPEALLWFRRPQPEASLVKLSHRHHLWRLGDMIVT